MMMEEGFTLTVVAIAADPRDLELITESLSRKSLRILTASDSRRGLQLVQQERPQVVLLDWGMPKKNGMELWERVLETDPGTEVILMATPSSVRAAVEAIQKGAS